MDRATPTLLHTQSGGAGSCGPADRGTGPTRPRSTMKRGTRAAILMQPGRHCRRSVPRAPRAARTSNLDPGSWRRAPRAVLRRTPHLHIPSSGQGYAVGQERSVEGTVTGPGRQGPAREGDKSRPLSYSPQRRAAAPGTSADVGRLCRADSLTAQNHVLRKGEDVAKAVTGKQRINRFLTLRLTSKRDSGSSGQ